MIFKTPPKLKNGDIRQIQKFAWIPKPIGKLNFGEVEGYVFWETYVEEQIFDRSLGWWIVTRFPKKSSTKGN